MNSKPAIRLQSLFALFAAISACLSGQTLKKIASIDPPRPKGQRFDYLTMDDEDGYLLSAHLGPGILYVIDVRTNTLFKARIYTACSSGAIAVYQEDDAEHFRKIEDFPVQKLVHSLAVDASTHRVYAPEQEEDGRPVARIIGYETVTGKEK